MRYVQVAHENYQRLVSEGQMLIIDDHIYEAVENPEYSGGFRVGGRSILNVLDECDQVIALGRPK
jgi:hypothetical protein